MYGSCATSMHFNLDKFGPLSPSAGQGSVVMFETAVTLLVLQSWAHHYLPEPQFLCLQNDDNCAYHVGLW